MEESEGIEAEEQNEAPKEAPDNTEQESEYTAPPTEDLTHLDNSISMGYENYVGEKEPDEVSQIFVEKPTVPQVVPDLHMPDRVSETLTDEEEMEDPGQSEEVTESKRTKIPRPRSVTISAPEREMIQESSEEVVNEGQDVTVKQEDGKNYEDVSEAADDDLERQVKSTRKQDENNTVDDDILTIDGIKREKSHRVSKAFDKSVSYADEPTKSPRKSIRNKAKSIVYEVKPRFRMDEEDLHRPSGDFGVATETDGDSGTKFYVYMDEAEEEEEEEEEFEEEEEIVRIDRAPYYIKHIILNEKIKNEKIRSSILQKKLSMFFKRRNMAHVLRETDQQFDTQLKYGRKLDMYGELLEVDQTQRSSTTKELDTLKEKREQKYNELTKLFNDMQEREKEIGSGLINTKTGNSIPDKLVERLIRRQKAQMDEVCAMRLKYLQLKEMVAEKENAIESLDKVGDGLHLMDYEQLKVENRSHSDKIEEKEEELTRLRYKCQNTIQILAHIREKSSALESDIDDVKEDIYTVQLECLQVRAQLNNAKQERDYYRLMTNKLRAESGLLTEPDLLRDMESSMEELKILSIKMEQLTEENKVKAQQIRNIRKNMDFTADTGIKKIYKSIVPKLVVKPQVYKGRPSLYKPSLPEHAFDYLKDFRPNVKIIKNKKI